MNLLQDILDQDMDPVETKEWVDALTAVIGAPYLLWLLVRGRRQATL